MSSIFVQLATQLKSLKEKLSKDSYHGYNKRGYGKEVIRFLAHIQTELGVQKQLPDDFLKTGFNNTLNVDLNWSKISGVLLGQKALNQQQRTEKEAITYLMGDSEVDKDINLSTLFEPEIAYTDLQTILDALQNPIASNHSTPNAAVLKKIQFITQYIAFQQDKERKPPNLAELTHHALTLALQHNLVDDAKAIMANIEQLTPAEMATILMLNDTNHMNPLMCACNTCPDAINQILDLMAKLDPGVQKNILLNVDKKGNNALMILREDQVKGFLEKVQGLLGFDPDTKAKMFSQMDTNAGLGNVLHRALEGRNKETIDFVLKQMEDLPSDKKSLILLGQKALIGNPLRAALRKYPEAVPAILNLIDLDPAIQTEIIMQTPEGKTDGNALLVAVNQKPDNQKPEPVGLILDRMQRLNLVQRRDILTGVNATNNNALMASILENPIVAPKILTHLKDLNTAQQAQILSQVNSDNDNPLTLAIKKNRPELINPLLDQIVKLSDTKQQEIFNQVENQGLSIPPYLVALNQNLGNLKELRLSTHIKSDPTGKKQKINFHLTKFLFSLNSGEDQSMIKTNFDNLLKTVKEHRSSIFRAGTTTSYKDLMQKLSEMGETQRTTLGKALSLKLDGPQTSDGKQFKKALENYDPDKSPASPPEAAPSVGGGVSGAGGQ